MKARGHSRKREREDGGSSVIKITCRGQLLHLFCRMKANLTEAPAKFNLGMKREEMWGTVLLCSPGTSSEEFSC